MKSVVAEIDCYMYQGQEKVGKERDEMCMIVAQLTRISKKHTNIVYIVECKLKDGAIGSRDLT